ncbi:MAG: hypothetical protein JNK29_07310, partial [Anaerolineales bacterium]|nr:hypothetical protein [Anaerolineales bacterium]
MDVALAETVVLIGELPGSLVYHLVLLFALQTAAAVALAGWRRERAPAAGRLALAASLSGLLVLASLVLTVLTAVPVFGGQTLYGPLILPPLARAVGTLNLLLWLWAAAFPAPSRAADVVAILLGVLILAGAGVSWVLWAQALAQGAGAYNGSLEDTVWGLAQAGLTVLGLIALILRASLRRPADLPVGGILALVLLAGQTLHLLFLWPGTSLPGTVRLAELVAAPLFMALVYRRALAGPALPPAAARPAAAAAEPARRGLDSKAAVALASLNTSADPDELAQIVTLAVAHACRAELCLLLSAPDDLGMCSLTCAYDLSRQQFIAGTFFSAAEMPALRAALRQDGVTSLAPAQHGPELRRLSGAAGLGSIGPTLIAPLGDEQQRLGALALMALYSHREWSAEEQNLL